MYLLKTNCIICKKMVVRNIINIKKEKRVVTLNIYICKFQGPLFSFRILATPYITSAKNINAMPPIVYALGISWNRNIWKRYPKTTSNDLRSICTIPAVSICRALIMVNCITKLITPTMHSNSQVVNDVGNIFSVPSFPSTKTAIAIVGMNTSNPERVRIVE